MPTLGSRQPQEWVSLRGKGTVTGSRSSRGSSSGRVRSRSKTRRRELPARSSSTGSTTSWCVPGDHGSRGARRHDRSSGPTVRGAGNGPPVGADDVEAAGEQAVVERSVERDLEGVARCRLEGTVRAQRAGLDVATLVATDLVAPLGPGPQRSTLRRRGSPRRPRAGTTHPAGAGSRARGGRRGPA